MCIYIYIFLEGRKQPGFCWIGGDELNSKTPPLKLGEKFIVKPDDGLQMFAAA